MNLLTQINQLEHLTSNEKSLCDYIRNHPMECLSKTPQQLAGDLYLSTSTVYRLLKKLDRKDTATLRWLFGRCASEIGKRGAGHQFSY